MHRYRAPRHALSRLLNIAGIFHGKLLDANMWTWEMGCAKLRYLYASNTECTEYQTLRSTPYRIEKNANTHTHLCILLLPWRKMQVPWYTFHSLRHFLPCRSCYHGKVKPPAWRADYSRTTTTDMVQNGNNLALILSERLPQREDQPGHWCS